MRKTCLIVGGGDCGIAEEVLKRNSVERLVQVEIDASVVEFAKQHFPEFTQAVFADPRFESVIGDGARYVAESDRRFDAIIVDSTDAQGPGAVLFTSDFYANCKRCLKAGGVLVTQNGVPFLQPDELRTSIRHFHGLFADASCYLASVPTYVGGHMAMGFATDDGRLRRAVAAMIATRYAAAGQFATR
jgi:spermidine synthase